MSILKIKGLFRSKVIDMTSGYWYCTCYLPRFRTWKASVFLVLMRLRRIGKDARVGRSRGEKMLQRSFMLLIAAVIAMAIPMVGPSSAQAASVTFETSIEFSGGTPPAAAVPWLTATFDDGGSAGSVDLSLETTNLTGSEFVFEWLFNLDPALNLNSLNFSAPTKIGAFTDPAINTGVDAFMADGDGFFDIQFLFDSTDMVPLKFGAGDAADYTITGIPTLTANSFNFLSASGGGQGTFPTAAKVGGIGPDDESGWVSVPEPGTLSLLLLGGLVMIRRRR